MEKNDSKEKNEKNEKFGVKIQPLTLSINDLLWVITAVVSVVVAWGMYGSRITVLEVNQLNTNQEIRDLKTTIAQMQANDILRDRKILELEIKNHIYPTD